MTNNVVRTADQETLSFCLVRSAWTTVVDHGSNFKHAIENNQQSSGPTRGPQTHTDRALARWSGPVLFLWNRRGPRRDGTYGEN